jgi:flagellar biosynthetic protein FlhB
MAEKPASERTEQPTPRRLQKALEKGQVAQSQELPAAVSIAVLVLVLVLTGRGLLDWFGAQMQTGLTGDRGVFADSRCFAAFANAQIGNALLIMAPLLAALLIGSVAACVTVSGVNFAPKALEFKFDAISPAKGFSELFNMRSVVRLGMSIAKLAFVAVIVWVYLKGELDTLAGLRWAWSLSILTEMSKIIVGLMVRACIGLLIIAAADVLYQKYKHADELKMTKQEVKEDRKETDGSPEVRGRIRSIQIQMARKRMLADVPKANVVLVNPTHVAVALRYDAKEMDSPVVVAKGADNMAEKIREVARAYGVPIVRRPELARAIYSGVDIGGTIPQVLYVAVAEVLAMIYKLRHRR